MRSWCGEWRKREGAGQPEEKLTGWVMPGHTVGVLGKREARWELSTSRAAAFVLSTLSRDTGYTDSLRTSSGG